MRVFQTDFQLQTFLYILYTGFFACAAHGLLSPLFDSRSFIFTLLIDLFLTALTAFFLFLSIFYSGSCELRLYMPFAFTLGGAVYHRGIGKLWKKCLNLLHGKRKSATSGE